MNNPLGENYFKRMSQRFFVPQPIGGERVRLDGEEGHHLARVMRARPGDEVILFDGGGAEFPARIVAVGRSAVELQVLERHAINRESPRVLSLGVALPKGERQRFLIEKAVELGATQLVPLETERGVAQPTAAALERLRRTAIEASKQCGRNRLMEIAPAATAADYFRAAPPDAVRWIAHPGGGPLRTALVGVGSHAPAFAAVGPEGGFTEAECNDAFAAGWRPVDLGPRILRVETAALLLAAWWSLETLPTSPID